MRFRIVKTHIALAISICVLLGFVLRILPGTENLIWSYDQARDAVVIRSILGEKNVIIVGPQTEFVGLSHGPLYYYFLAPFYHIGQSNLTIPLLAMIVLNISAVVPVFLLARSLFKNNDKAGLLASLLFVVSYQQVEYARWLSNVSITIPFLAWFYYFLWKLSKESYNLTAVLTGLTLALAIQGEIFLLYLIPFVYLVLYFFKKKMNVVLRFHLGLLIGLSSFIIAELKFNFLATKTFIGQFLFGAATGQMNAGQAVIGYLDHLGLTVYQNAFGLTSAMGLIAFVFGLIYLAYAKDKIKKFSSNNTLLYILLLIFSHSLLFSFHYVDSVFLDISITIPMILFLTAVIWSLLQTKQQLIAYSVLFLALLSQLVQLRLNTIHQTPMQIYKFHQGGILFSQKKEIVSRIYQLVDEHSQDRETEFTFGVLGSPYGVQTTWATVFENYLVAHPDQLKPNWYGFQALGYPYDSFFDKVDHPGSLHILVIEDNIVTLTNEKIVREYLVHINESTNIIAEEDIYGFKVQVREKLSD